MLPEQHALTCIEAYACTSLLAYGVNGEWFETTLQVCDLCVLVLGRDDSRTGVWV